MVSEEQDKMMVTRLAEMLELVRLLGLEPDSKTLAKIFVLQKLLKKGFSLHWVRLEKLLQLCLTKSTTIQVSSCRYPKGSSGITTSYA